MSTTQARLDAYKAAELQILQGRQSVRFGDRQLTHADLIEVRKAIAQLEAQLASELAAAQGRGGLRYTTAVFCRR
jgi:phage FluMu protein gp41